MFYFKPIPFVKKKNRNYRSLGEFFARSLKADARFIDPGCLVSPCDGKILHFGPASNNQIEQVRNEIK